MELIGDLKKKVEAAESLDEAKKVLADAGMALTDDELNAVSGGRILRPKISRKGGSTTMTLRVTNGAGAPIFDKFSALDVRSQIGLYPCGTEFTAARTLCYGGPGVEFYRARAQDGYPAGFVLTTDAVKVEQ